MSSAFTVFAKAGASETLTGSLYASMVRPREISKTYRLSVPQARSMASDNARSWPAMYCMKSQRSMFLSSFPREKKSCDRFLQSVAGASKFVVIKQKRKSPRGAD